MVKFYGLIGYGENVETKPGVWQDVIVEREAYGDVRQNSRLQSPDDQVNPDIRISNFISIVADPYANEHFFNIRYLTWQGERWVVANVTVEPPRLVLRLGGLYNGPTS